jgi:hypothetical protein
MLAANSYVQQIYIAWCAFYSVSSILLLYLCLVYYWHSAVREEEELNHYRINQRLVPVNWCCRIEYLKRLYVGFCSAYVPLTFIKLGCAWAIAWVTVHNTPAHQILAGLAFGSAIFISLLLFIRRVILKGIQGEKRTHLGIFFYVFNGVYSFTLLGLGIVFCVLRTGEYEFTIMLMVVLDPIFQIYDFYHEPNFKEMFLHQGGISTSFPRVKLPKRKPLNIQSRHNTQGDNLLERMFYKKKVG